MVRKKTTKKSSKKKTTKRKVVKATKKKTVKKTSKKLSTAPAVSHTPKTDQLLMTAKRRKEKTLFHHYHTQIISLILSIFILIFFFKPKLEFSADVVFFMLFGIAALLLADFFYRHEHKPHDATIIGCLFFIPPVLTYVLFQQLWAAVLIAMMAWALISAIVVHFHHKKGEHLTEVMWVAVYSHMIAFSAALVLFALLSYIMPGQYISTMSAILLYLVPPIFLHFFISHYLYKHHFDPKHPLHDLLVGVKWGLISAVILFIALAALFGWASASNFKLQTESYIESLTFDSDFMEGLIISMDSPPTPLEGLPIYEEVKIYLDQVHRRSLSKADNFLNRDVAITNFLDDSYADLSLEMMKDDFTRYVDLFNIQQAKSTLDDWAIGDKTLSVAGVDVTTTYSRQISLPGYETVQAALYSEELSPLNFQTDLLPAMDALLITEKNRLSTVLSGMFLFDDSYVFQRFNTVVTYTRFYSSVTKNAFFLFIELPHMFANSPLWNGLMENIYVEEPVKSKKLRYLLLINAGQRQQQLFAD